MGRDAARSLLVALLQELLGVVLTRRGAAVVVDAAGPDRALDRLCGGTRLEQAEEVDALLRLRLEPREDDDAGLFGRFDQAPRLADPVVVGDADGLDALLLTGFDYRVVVRGFAREAVVLALLGQVRVGVDLKGAAEEARAVGEGPGLLDPSDPAARFFPRGFSRDSQGAQEVGRGVERMRSRFPRIGLVEVVSQPTAEQVVLHQRPPRPTSRSHAWASVGFCSPAQPASLEGLGDEAQLLRIGARLVEVGRSGWLVGGAPQAFAGAKTRPWVTAMRWRARLSWRFPPRSRR